MADFDVLVIGGGPAGYAAALKAAETGATVALVEAEKPGGACVHYSCIPTNIMLSAALTHVEARALGIMGVFQVGDDFNLGRAAARKDALVQKVADGIRASLKMRRVEVIQGRAAFADSGTVELTAAAGRSRLRAEAIIIATGTRWDAPAVPGVAPERVLTADGVQALREAPRSALVLGGGPFDQGFALEYATLLALSGTAVTLTTTATHLLSGLDGALSEVASAALTDLGVTVLTGAAAMEGDGSRVTVRRGAEAMVVDAEVVVAPDVRRPHFETLNMAAAGVEASDRIPVDSGCRTNVPGIFAAGDVTGGVMLSSAATHMGEVTGVNAAGGEAVTRLAAIPHLLHTMPEIAWAGRTEEQARAEGYDVRTGLSDLSFNARAIVLGARQGIVKVVAERELGELLGVHAVGPGAGEIVAIAAAMMQSQATVHDLAATVFWHPTMAEGLVDAARRAAVG